MKNINLFSKIFAIVKTNQLSIICKSIFVFSFLLFIILFFNRHHSYLVQNIYMTNFEKHFYSFLKRNISEYKYENSSKDYWERRYKKGGNSGAGSYNNLAIFKASVLNNFIKKKNIKTVIELGCGDCNQLSLSNYKSYIGYDVSKTAIEICKKMFFNDSSKKFEYMTGELKIDKMADLSLSLDVIYHLLEDKVFKLYMKNLFDSSKKFVCIYSSNVEGKWDKHVRHRKFTNWIKKYKSKNWKMIDFIPNKYPFDIKNDKNTSFSDFYFYKKMQ